MFGLGPMQAHGNASLRRLHAGHTGQAWWFGGDFWADGALVRRSCRNGSDTFLGASPRAGPGSQAMVR